MDRLEVKYGESVDNILTPFLNEYGFIRDKEGTFRRNNNYMLVTHSGFVVHDYPWQIDLFLGSPGFKKTTAKFDQVTLTYWKNKIAPFDDHSKNNMHISTEIYLASGEDEIEKSMKQITFDLEHFANDFLNGDNERLDRIRTISYLEYLTRANVYGTYYSDRPKEIEIKYNDAIE